MAETLKTITQLTAAAADAALTVELPGYDPASAAPQTKKWTVAEVLAALKTPSFTTITLGGGAPLGKVLTGQVTSVVTSLGSGSDTTVTDTLTGAAVGDHVIANPTTTPSTGFTWFFWVSAPNTISIRVHNHLGGGPASGTDTWDILIFRTP